MLQLKCTCNNCQHNLKGHCDAGLISVSEKTNCQSRIKRPGGALEQTFKEMETSEEFLQEAPSVVQCDALCVYNEDNRCHATSIKITDTLFSVKCATRVKP